MSNVLMKLLLFLFSLMSYFSMQGQYTPGVVNFGFSVIKVTEPSVWGGGARVEYAYNCFTTFIGEVSYLDSNKDPYGEFAAGVNLILFNFYPTTITTGIGYVVNNDTDFVNVEDEAFLVFPTGSLNHGAQIKLRALQRLSATTHLFAEASLKSLGVNYHSFQIGMNYNFDARR